MRSSAFGKARNGALVLPVLFLLWVNTHGSFVVGMGAIAAYYIGGLWEFTCGDIESRRWLPAERQQLSLVFLLC